MSGKKSNIYVLHGHTYWNIRINQNIKYYTVKEICLIKNITMLKKLK